MTELDWLTSTDPSAMWRFIRDRVTERQMAFCLDVFVKMVSETPPTVSAHNFLPKYIRDSFGAWCTRNGFIDQVPFELRAGLLRTIIGNPFHRIEFPIKCKCGQWDDAKDVSVPPRCKTCCAEMFCPWLTYNDGAVGHMLDEVMTEEIGPTTDVRGKSAEKSGFVPRAEPKWELLLLVADILEEAGCTEQTILNWLRGWEVCPWCMGSVRRGEKYVFAGPESHWEDCSHCSGTGKRAVTHVVGDWCVELLRREL